MSEWCTGVRLPGARFSHWVLGMPGVLLLVGMWGCTTPPASQINGVVMHQAAAAIAGELSGVLVSRAGLDPSDPICVARGADQVFAGALAAQLRDAGYSVQFRWIDGDRSAGGVGSAAQCVVYRGSVVPGLTQRVRFGTFCLRWAGAAVCREYELPSARPLSSLSITGFAVSDAPVARGADHE